MKKNITAQAVIFLNKKQKQRQNGDDNIRKIEINGERKNLWCIPTSELKRNHPLRFALMRRIFKLCAEGFEQGRSKSFKIDVENHVMGETASCFIFQNKIQQHNPSEIKKNPLLAFVSYRIIEVELGGQAEKIVYFSAIMIAKGYRGQKVSAGMIQAIMKKHGAHHMALRTQNPVMRESVKEACLEVFPDLAGKESPQEFVRIGEAVAKQLRMSHYDKRLMTEEGTYGKSLYGETIPALSGELMVLNAAFWKMVNVFRGDSMIVVGRGIKE